MRRGLYAASITVGLVCIALWIISRSWFIVAFVKPELSNRLGGEVTIGSAAYEGGGRFLLRDVVLRSPDHEGLQGEVLSVSKFLVRVHEWRLLRGQFDLQEVELNGVMLRLAEDADDAGNLTIMSLVDRQQDEEAAGIDRLPRVRLRNATVENGLFSGDGYQVIGQRRFAGLMQPHPALERAYSFELVEIDENGDQRRDGEGGVTVDGVWKVETNECFGSVASVVLDSAAYDMLPRAVRQWWDLLELEGRLAGAQFHWREDEPLSITFEIENVGLTLPAETEENIWARYLKGQVIAYNVRPRLSVHRGKIRFEDNAILFEEPLIGELSGQDAASVPYEVTVNVFDLQPAEWDDREAWNRVFETVPFEMKFAIKDFRIAPDQHGNLPPVDLPLVVARALERFLLSDFALSAQMIVVRDEDGLLSSEGAVSIRDATASYEEFPYPLRSVDAELTFDMGQVRIDSLRGIAPSGAPVSIQGTITPPVGDPEVALRLKGEGAPVDEHLRSAMRFKGLAFFDTLMSIPAELALRASGRMAEADEQGRNDSDRFAPHPPFQLGGKVDLDLRIDRARGPNQPTQVTGTISIDSLGMVYEHFPYPFTVIGGALRLEPNGVWIIDDDDGGGVPIVTAGGGVGTVTGGVNARVVDGELRAEPDLFIDVSNDRANPLITAAIPPGRKAAQSDVWPGEVFGPVALLESAGLDGTIDFTGRIHTDDSGSVRYEFNVDFQGQAQPRDDLAARLSDAGLLWPNDLVIEHVKARVRVTDEEIALLDFDGSHRHGLIDARGRINWTDQEETYTELDIDLIDLELGPYLIALVPGEGAETVERLWDKYDPSGRFNATLVFRSLGENVEPPRLLIDPSRTRLVIGEETIVLSRESGRMTLRAGRVRFDDLVVRFFRGVDGLDDGAVVLDGSYGLNGESPQGFQIAAAWSGGRFESPLIVEAIRLFGAERHLAQWQQLNPRGRFDADFRHAGPAGEKPAVYGVTLRPSSLLIDLADTTLDARLSNGSIVLGEESIHINSLRGSLGSDSFAISGSIRTTSPLSVTIKEIEFDGALLNEQVQALLPEGVRNLLVTIEFEDGERTRVENGRLTLEQVAEGASRWKTGFSGSLRTNGASFTAGARVTDFDGVIGISYEDGQSAPRLRLDVLGERLLVAGRRLVDLSALGITLSENGRSLLVPEIRADSYGGVFWAEATVGLAEGEAYEARLELVGAGVAGIVSGEQESPRPPARQRQGKVNAGVRLAGITGDPNSRTGRGVIRAIGGSLENVPFIVQVMQILQLTLPVRGTLDHAHIEFFIEGDEAVFERILFESTFGEVATLQFIGDGEVNLRTQELRTQFRSRGGMLLIRDLVGGLSDQLYAIEIVGTLQNPRARLVPLPGLAQQAAATPRNSIRRDAAVQAIEPQ